MADTIRKHGARRTTLTHRGDVFVLNDLKDEAINQLIKWVAVLRGGVLCTPQFILSGGQTGASIAYVSAFSFKRVLWCSDECNRKYPKTIAMIKKCMSSTSGHRWT
eukprot:9036079-Pyramimonas_sp.AAC.1